MIIRVKVKIQVFSVSSMWYYVYRSKSTYQQKLYGREVFGFKSFGQNLLTSVVKNKLKKIIIENRAVGYKEFHD